MIHRVKDFSYPRSAIGFIEITKKDDTYGRCTGFIIDENIVLTANHCLFEGSEQYDNIIFVPAFHPDEEFHDAWKVTSLIRQERHFNEFDLDDPVTVVQWDYAFLIMEKKNGRSIGQKYGDLQWTKSDWYRLS